MRTGRVAAVLGSLLTVFAALPAAAHPPRRVAPERSNGANIPSGGGGNIPGRTLRDSGVGCGECHGAKAYAGNTPAVTISGPSTLNAGSTGSFTIKTVHPSVDQSKFTGVDVASSNFAGLTTSDGNAQLVGNEITHSAPAKLLSNAAATGYTFSYQMPAGLPAGSARTLYGASAVGFGFGWNTSPNFNVVVPLGGNGPTGVTVVTSTSSSIKLAWSGNSAAAYQVNYQTGGYVANSSQGFKKLVYNNTSTEITGLSPLTTYYFTVWATSELPAGNDPGTQLYSSNFAQVSGSTPDIPPNTHPLLRTGSMGTARFGHTATLLPNGKVLIAGGQNASTPYQTAEIHDPLTGTFSATVSMTVARSGHTATALFNGKVLITGGSASTAAELYDPYNNTFTQTTGPMSTARTGHTATLLPSGKVLIAGGTTSVTAEVFDPSAGTFSATLSMGTARFFHTATLLTNGKVLLAGGSSTTGGTAMSSAELYTPGTNSFAGTTNSLTNARKYHTATGLTVANSGSVSFIGGVGGGGTPLNSLETYDTASNSFTNATTGPYATYKHSAVLLPDSVLMVCGGRASNGSALDTISGDAANWILSEPRASHTSTVMPNGRVLIAGGADSSGNPIASAELYDTNLDVGYYPITVAGSFSPTGTMSVKRSNHTATLLPNGNVLVAGGDSTTAVNGDGCSYEWDTAELYDPDGFAFTATTGNMNKHRTQHTATLLPNGKVLIAGGYWSCFSEHLKAAELYDPSLGTFADTGDMNVRRLEHTATLLANGKVLIAGGFGTNGPVNSAELYDPNTGVFSNTGNMTVPRQNHSATLLPNGKVLIAGGSNDNGTLYSAEIYDPTTGAFTASNSTVYYQTQRENHVATLLPMGKVLVADGNLGVSSIYSALLYDPATDDYGLVNCCLPQNNGGRVKATGTLLPDGRVIMIGGYNEGGKLNTAEVYDPELSSSYLVQDNFSNIGTLGTARSNHMATLMRNGQILVTGGAGASANLDTAEVFSLSRTPSSFGVSLPSIASAPSTLYLPATMSITGTGFRLDTEGSNGGGANSAGDVPLLRLQRVDNDQLLFIRPSNRDATSFLSTIQSGLADGYYRASIVSNAAPSLQAMIAIRTVALVAPSVTATATSTVAVGVSWSAVNGAATYEVFRTEDNVNYVSRGVFSGTTLADSAQSGKAYLYKVHAIDALNTIGPDSGVDLATTVIFTDDPLVLHSTTVKAAHITELRTAVNAVRTLAGLSAGSYTDTTITAHSTTIRAVHMTDLRSALGTARSTLGLSTLSFTDPSLTSGFGIKAAHITELRNGVK